MAKVLLIQPNYNIDKLGSETPAMPLALIELATFIREKGGHEAKILDRNLYYDNEKLLRIIKNFEPDIVGMTCYTSPVIKDIRQISEFVKKNSHAMVIIGGIHATLEPKSLLDFPYIDYIVRGEGEYPLLEICELVDKKKATQKNILKLKNVNYNLMRDFIDLREVPVPDYELIEVKKYPIATFYTSRGCPGRCKFCYNLGRQLRFYDSDKVIKTFENVLGKYKLKEFTIADDNFANLSKRTTRLCDALSKYNAVFHIFLRVDQAHDKVMKELKKAGCWAIQFGFESGSQRVLDFIGKDTKVEQNIDALKKCRKYGIFSDGSFMIGLPTETISEMNETVGFIKKYKPDSVNVKIFKPFPSTELYNYVIKKKIIKAPKTLEEWEDFCDLTEGNVNVSDIPTELLLRTVKKLNIEQSNKMYVKKAVLLLLKGHFKYVFKKTKAVVLGKLRNRVV